MCIASLRCGQRLFITQVALDTQQYLIELEIIRYVTCYNTARGNISIAWTLHYYDWVEKWQSARVLAKFAWHVVWKSLAERSLRYMLPCTQQCVVNFLHIFLYPVLAVLFYVGLSRCRLTIKHSSPLFMRGIIKNFTSQEFLGNSYLS